MYPISNDYKNVIYSGDARHKLKLLFNGVEYQSANSKVESVKRTSKILSDGGERFSLDNFKAQELEIVINDINLEDIIEPVSVSIGTLVNDAYEYVPIGIFNLNEKPQTNSGKTTIKLIDNAVKFDVPYNAQDIIEENGGEASLLQILQDICTKCEVTLSTTDFVNKDTKVSVWDNSINARQYVMYIAEIAGRIATINRSGELELIDLQKGSDIEVEINNPTEINNVLPRPINGLQLKGNTYQQTYTGKNLLKTKYPYSAINNNGVTCTISEDGTITLNGTATNRADFNCYEILTPLIANKKYSLNLIYISGSYNGTLGIYNEDGNHSWTGWDMGISSSQGMKNYSIYHTYDWNWQSSVSIVRAFKDTVYNNYKFKLQFVADVNYDYDFEPYVGATKSPNPDYPQSIENVTGLQTIDVVGKNLLPYPYTDTTKTVNGITFTDLGDGTIKVNGTATANASFRLLGSSSQQYTINGNYIYGGLTSDIRVQVVHYNPGYTVLGKSIGSSVQINKNTYTTGYIEIVVQNGQVVNNQIIKPMLTLTQDNVYEEYKGQSYEINLGKNLFDKDNANLIDGQITSNKTLDTSTGKTLWIPCKPNTTYTLSKITSNRSRAGSSKELLTTSNTLTNYVAESTPIDNDRYKATITTGPQDKYLYFTYRNTSDTEILDSIQIEVGSQATSYSEYFTPIELNKIGDYQDRIYKQNNKWYIEKKIGKIVLDGSESILTNKNMTYVYQFIVENYANQTNIYDNNALVMSNYFKYKKGDPTNSTNEDYIWQFQNFLVVDIRKEITPTLNDFKTWLSNNKPEIKYILATPEITEITNTDLIEQLDSIELLKGYNYVSIYSDNLVSGLSINYQSERQPIELDSWLFEKYTVGDKLKISRVVYEDAIRKFEHGDESEGTLYINSANPYIINQGEIDNTYSIINDLEMYSMNITKMIGNPAIDPWDMLEFEYNDNKYQFLGQNTLNYRGTIIQSFNTQIGSNAKSQENVTINAEDSKFKRIFTRIDQAEGNIELNTSQITNVQGDLEQNYYTKEQANILIQNAETGVTNTFSEAGGNNIFRNTGLWFADDKVTEYIYPSSTTYPSSDLYPLSQQHYEFWDGYVEKIKNDNSSNLSSMLLKNGYVQQKQTVPNGNYTVSFKYKKLINVATCKVFINGVEYPLTQTTDTEFVTGYKDTEGHYVTQPLEVSNREIMVKFYTDADNACEIYDLMVNAGTVKLAYSQNQNETKTDTVNISKGITITSTDTDTIFKANADGIRTLNQNNNVLTEFTDTGMKTKKMEVNEEAQICGTLIKEVANQTWFTKL